MRLRERGDRTVLSPDGVPELNGSPKPDAGRRRWPRVLAPAVVVALAGSTLVWAVSRGSGSSSKGAPSDKATATATVSRQDLVSRTEVDGTLGYVGETNVVNQLQGTLTAIAAEGSVVERGQPLFHVDNRPVPLLYGDLPAWRRLARGVDDGPDVAQLERNLVAMGIATEAQLTVDDHFNAATAAAVKRWQAQLGVDQTGAIETGEVVFVPGAIRVGAAKAEKGTAAPTGAPVFSSTSTTRVVTVDLDATKQAQAKVGDKVEITLPDGRRTAGVIADVGTVVQTKGSGESAKRVVTVTVNLDDPATTGTIDQAPVRVAITAESRKGVLTVPVNALLALAEGGYGVRVVDGSGSHIVAVTTGLFAKGTVEVSGEGLVEGLTVEVPAS